MTSIYINFPRTKLKYYEKKNCYNQSVMVPFVPSRNHHKIFMTF